MARVGSTGTPVNGVTYVWRFLIKGGQPVDLTLTEFLGPPLNHNGVRRTLWQMVGTLEQAEAVKAMLTGPLVGAKVEMFTDAESDEERDLLLNRQVDGLLEG